MQMKHKLAPWFNRYNFWTYTKSNLWKQCKKHYYYRYYVVPLESSSSVDVFRVKKLRYLQTKAQLRGILVHDAIEKCISTKALDFEIPDLIRCMEDQIAPYIAEPKVKITEFYNSGIVDENTFIDMKTDIIHNFVNFYNIVLPELKKYEYVGHENLDMMNVWGVPVGTKLDYLCKDPETGQYIIFDWKTGRIDGAFDYSLQVKIYMLWAYKKFGTENIEARLEYLPSGKRKIYNFTKDDIESTELEVINSFNDMNEDYSPERFVANPTHFNCSTCQFASMCAEKFVR